MLNTFLGFFNIMDSNLILKNMEYRLILIVSKPFFFIIFVILFFFI